MTMLCYGQITDKLRTNYGQITTLFVCYTAACCITCDKVLALSKRIMYIYNTGGVYVGTSEFVTVW